MIPVEVRELAKRHTVTEVSDLTGFTVNGLKSYAKRHRFSFKSRNKPRIDVFVVRVLLKAKFSIQQCSIFMGKNYAVIMSVVKRKRLKVLKWRRRAITKDMRKAIYRMCGSGVPLWYIAKVTGRSYATIRTVCSRERIRHPYRTQGKRGMVGLPPAEDDIKAKMGSVIARLRVKYPTVPRDDIVSAVDIATAELVQHPKNDGWIALWHTIAQRRLVDDIREVTGRTGAKLPKGEREVLFEHSAEANVDPAGEIGENIEAVRLAVSKLPADLRRMMTLLLDNDYNKKKTAQMLGIHENTLYAQIALAFPLLKEKLCGSYHLS